MRLGALLGPVLTPEDPRTLARQAAMFESAGYESLWSAQAIGRGFMLPDPFVALSCAAAVTSQVELGTAVVQAPLYHPADLAHRVLSLSQVAGDRLLLGIGAGSTEADFRCLGRDHAARFATFSAMLEPLRELLRHGNHADTSLSPWPAVLGRVPLLLGSWGEGVVRAAGHFDGWIASGNHRTPAQIHASLARYRAAGGGRAIVSTLILTARTDPGELRERLQGFAEAGFDDAVVMFQPGAPHPDRVRALVQGGGRGD
jgi:alkanesulfonate monooxygenase SsuD/methylene tetrahydromethanopterin reductase-like flavin-dependent oxidoreductase (luciferase family)